MTLVPSKTAMKVTVTRTWTFTVQRLTTEICDKFGKSHGTVGVLDEDGDRYSFAETETEALNDIREVCESDSVYGGSVDLQS